MPMLGQRRNASWEGKSEGFEFLDFFHGKLFLTINKNTSEYTDSIPIKYAYGFVVLWFAVVTSHCLMAHDK